MANDLSQIFLSPVAEFYSNKSIFITGATGFMGKVLLEKLLRQYDDIRCIYVLIRPKRGQTPEERFKQQIINSPIFDRLRQQLKEQNSSKNDQQDDDDDGRKKLETLMNSKIKCIEGDVAAPGLGINDRDWNLLLEDEHLSLVFHLAATVRFNEPLKKALQLNVAGVKSMLKFSRQLKNLICFCHVSTAYVNSDIIDGKQIIEEQIYPVKEDPDAMISMIKSIDDSTMKQLENDFLGLKPNTYTYTKSLAEKLILQQGQDLPIVIVRPSIVVAAWREPVRGWVDNLYGITGAAVGHATGIMRIIRLDENKQADLVPVDTCIGTIIAAVWHKATGQSGMVSTRAIEPQDAQRKESLMNHKKNSSRIHQNGIRFSGLDHAPPPSNNNGNGQIKTIEDNLNRSVIDASEKSSNNSAFNNKTDTSLVDQTNTIIYHCTSAKLNRITWGLVIRLMAITAVKLPPGRVMRVPLLIPFVNAQCCYILRFFSHTLMAHLVDLMLLLTGRKRFMVKYTDRQDQNMDVYEHFTCNQWEFKTDNMVNLYNCLHEVDKKQLYSMNIRNMHWHTYWYDYTLSTKRFILREKIEDLPRMRSQFSKVTKINSALRIISLIVTLPLMISLIFNYPLFNEWHLSPKYASFSLIFYIVINIWIWL